MSDSEDSKADAAEEQTLDRLEVAVDRLIEAHAAAVGRAEKAESRVQELEEHLRKLAEDGADPVQLQEALEKLKDRNADLRRRVAEGREGVERLISRIRFLESRG